MNIIGPNNTEMSKIIKPIDDEIINILVQEALKIKRDDEPFNLYSRFYTTKYKSSDLTREELSLFFHLRRLISKHSDMIRTSKQGREYEWIKINSSQIGDTTYRFYLAPNPENMHEIVKRLSSVFVERKVPVNFKYQLKSKTDECDRIIIYSDFSHKADIERAISDVYKENPELFAGSERAVSWIYKTSIPNVYLAPETKGISYGERFAEIMFQAKLIFCYLYGITSSNPSLSLSETFAKNAIDYMKLIITSLLFRNGLLLSNDERLIRIKDKNVRTRYDFDMGILINSNEDSNGYTEVKFFPTPEGRNALLKNFYSVSQIQPQPGLQIRYLTPAARKNEINMILYGDYYKHKEQSVGVPIDNNGTSRGPFR